MAITEVDSATLGKIRQLEALIARCYPCDDLVYSGTWAIRFSSDESSPYLGNTISPLDPSDDLRCPERLQRLVEKGQKLQPSGRVVDLPADYNFHKLRLRLTPLAPPSLADYVAGANGWRLCSRQMIYVGQCPPYSAEKTFSSWCEATDLNEYRRAIPQAKLVAPNSPVDPSLIDKMLCRRPLHPVLLKNNDRIIGKAIIVKDGNFGAVMELFAKESDHETLSILSLSLKEAAAASQIEYLWFLQQDTKGNTLKRKGEQETLYSERHSAESVGDSLNLATDAMLNGSGRVGAMRDRTNGNGTSNSPRSLNSTKASSSNCETQPQPVMNGFHQLYSANLWSRYG